MAEIPSQPIAEDTDILQELTSVLEGNGTIPAKARETLMLKMLGAIYQLDRSMDKRIKNLEEYTPWLKVFKYIAVGVAAAVGALLWAIFTHEVQITFH